MIFVLNIDKFCLIVHNFLSKLAEIFENSFKIFLMRILLRVDARQMHDHFNAFIREDSPVNLFVG